MNRKTALAAAAAVTMTVAAGAVAIAANLGVLGASADDRVGKLSPAGDTPEVVETTFVDVTPSSEVSQDDDATPEAEETVEVEDADGNNQDPDESIDDDAEDADDDSSDGSSVDSSDDHSETEDAEEDD